MEPGTTRPWGQAKVLAAVFAGAAVVLGLAAFTNPDRGQTVRLPASLKIRQANAAPLDAVKPLGGPTVIADSPVAAGGDEAVERQFEKLKAHLTATPAGPAADVTSSGRAIAATTAPEQRAATLLPGSPEFWSRVSKAGYGASLSVEISPDGARAGTTVVLTCRAELAACPPPPHGEGLRIVYRDREGGQFKSELERRQGWR